MFYWAAYDVSTGRVREAGMASTLEDTIIQPLEGESVLVVEERDGDYVGRWTMRNGLPDVAEIELEEALAIVGARQGDSVVDDRLVKATEPSITVTVAMVKAEQGRRLKYTDWAITRAADPTDGTPIPDSILSERQAIRAAAAALEAMDPIPGDYRDPKYWQ